MLSWKNFTEEGIINKVLMLERKDSIIKQLPFHCSSLPLSNSIWRSSHWLPKVECPVLIMHAADDTKVNNPLYLKRPHTTPLYDKYSTAMCYSSTHQNPTPPLCISRAHNFILCSSKAHNFIPPTQVPAQLSKQLFDETVKFDFYDGDGDVVREEWWHCTNGDVSKVSF